MDKPVNSNNLAHTSAAWYDSDDPTNRRVCVQMHKGAMTIATRDNPSDVWGPPKKMYLHGSVDTN